MTDEMLLSISKHECECESKRIYKKWGNVSSLVYVTPPLTSMNLQKVPRVFPAHHSVYPLPLVSITPLDGQPGVKGAPHAQRSPLTPGCPSNTTRGKGKGVAGRCGAICPLVDDVSASGLKPRL